MTAQRVIRFLTIGILAVTTLALVVPARADCDDPAGDCAGLECPAANTCYADADCGEGFVCDLPTLPGDPCRPSECYCETCCGDPYWGCTDDCAGLCVVAPEEPVPAASEWMLIQLALLVLAGGTLVFGGAPRVRCGPTDGVISVAVAQVRPAMFVRLALLALGLTFAGLGIATLTGLEPGSVDVRGSLVSAVLVAFVLHLWI